MNLHETYLVGRSVVRVLGDSGRTEEIHRVEELTGRARYRRLMAQLRDQGDMRRLLRDRPMLCSDVVDFDALRDLPADTLGRAYVRHLDDNGLTADSQAVPTSSAYVSDPDMAYLMRRFRQTHDVWHVLLGLGTAGHEEVILHAFSYGQLRLPVSALVVFFGTAKHIVLEGRMRALRHGLLDAYRSGRDAAPLLPVCWEDLWSEPLGEVRERYRVRPLDPARVHA